MSFRIKHFLYFLAQFIQGIFFVLIGTFTIVLPWSDTLQNVVEQFINERTFVGFLLGLGFILVGVLLTIHAYTNIRRRYIEISINNNKAIIDENLVKQYLERYWKEYFPIDQVPTRLKIDKNSIQIFADFPYIPENEQTSFLERAQADLKDIFNRLLGYHKEIRLMASFQKSMTETVEASG